MLKQNKKIITILLCEVLCLVLFTGLLFHVQAAKTPDKKAAEKTTEKVQEDESVAKTMDEFVWTTDYADGMKGPGEHYEYLTTFNKEAGLQRVAVTKNGWSKVIVEEKTYYVPSDKLSIKSPYTLDEGDKGVLQEYALSQLPKYGWDESEMDDLITLWNKESGWNPRAENEESGAYGIPQSLPADKMATVGDDYRTNGRTQIDWGLQYIKDRYGSPSNALQYHLENNWY